MNAKIGLQVNSVRNAKLEVTVMPLRHWDAGNVIVMSMETAISITVIDRLVSASAKTTLKAKCVKNAKKVTTEIQEMAECATTGACLVECSLDPKVE